MTAPHLALTTSFQDATILGAHRRFSIESDDPKTVVGIRGGSGTGDTTDGVPICELSAAKPTSMSAQKDDSSGALKYVLLQGSAPDAIWADGDTTSASVAADNTAYTPGTSGDWDSPPTKADDALDELAGRVKDLEVSNETAQATISIELAGGMLAAGTPLAAFADNAGASAPGITLADSKAKGVRWNNQGTQTAVWYQVSLPQDLDDAAAVVLHFLLSKSGATSGDATKITVTAFFQTVGALHDADTDCGGDSNALTGNATAKTVAELTLSIAAGDVPAAPCGLSFSIKPKDGTLGTDDAIVSAMWIEYTRKALTS